MPLPSPIAFRCLRRAFLGSFHRRGFPSGRNAVQWAAMESLEPRLLLDGNLIISEFMALNEPALGTCQTCSLISPVIDIERHEDAVKIAEQVMDALFVTDDSDAKRDAERKQMVEAARLRGEPVLDKPLSRRDFLRGSFLGM